MKNVLIKKMFIYFGVLIVAILLVIIINRFTNTTPPMHDALYYVNMAQEGIIGNDHLVAPFAYRPGVSILAKIISELLSVPIDKGFQIVGYIAMTVLLMSTYVLARCFTNDYFKAIFPMIIIGFSQMHIKFPLYFYSMVDVASYPLIIIAFCALVKERYMLCLVVSSTGLIFREFLVIPLILLIVVLIRSYWRERTRKILLYLIFTIVISISIILFTRLFITIQSSCQEIDPINNISSLKKILWIPLNDLKVFNIIVANLSYWLPSLLLLTTKRINIILEELKNIKGLIIIYLSLILIMTMYGGHNYPIYVAYSVSVQIVILSIIIKNGVHPIEVVFVLLVIIIYNKIFKNIPSLQENHEGFSDFYAGWSSIVSVITVVRFLEMFICFLIINLIRTVIKKQHSISNNILEKY